MSWLSHKREKGQETAQIKQTLKPEERDLRICKYWPNFCWTVAPYTRPEAPQWWDKGHDMSLVMESGQEESMIAPSTSLRQKNPALTCSASSVLLIHAPTL